MKYTLLKRELSVLLIFIMLCQLPNCFTIKTITGEITNTQLPSPEKYNYVICTRRSQVWLENTTISKDSLSGKIGKMPKHHDQRVYIFLSSDSVIKITNDRIFSVNLTDIVRVKTKVTEKGLTITLIVVGGVVGGGAAVVLLIYMLKGLYEFVSIFDED
jgi:biopolymer transport protein ExbD